ncbi:helix-turn-helix transcriptional regulator [Phycisphaerales bacterium AB-hyl4]|uniref:Helix-turn-helix transcriptional regulator n=1 Tax=Natronomicrosphaera hydrolytica TaxID=3242702 RepID=A0ABV4U424_9BACT
MAPWAFSDTAFWETLQPLIPHTAMLLALADRDHPEQPAVLSSHGIDAERLHRWHSQSAEGADAANEVFADQGHLLQQTFPASPNTAQQWHLVLLRTDRSFEPVDQQLAFVVLRQINAAFDHLPEPNLRRLLISHDHRLLHADPLSEASGLREPALLTRFIEQLRKLIAQRWPNLDDDAVHNLPMMVDDEPTWVRFRRRLPVNNHATGPWYVEMRPLTEHDAPAVGLVDDGRVAQAIAYLSDNYASAPTLNDVADAVQVSSYHFHRLFVRHAGISPKHYLLRTQLMIARWLLSSTRRPVGDIATATGFASHGHFTATFHRHLGISPTTFRESAATT